MTYRRIALAFSCLLAIAPAHATGAIESLITDADRQRLAEYEQTKHGAVGEARAGAPAADFAQLESLLNRPRLSFEGLDLTGDWQCRVTKVGGIAPLVAYGWFRCRVSDDGSGWWLEKLDGSQRTQGGFYDDGKARMIYLGSGYVVGDPAPKYGSGPQSDQVGYAYRTDAAQWHIEFPAPAYESKLDILELRR